MFKFFKRIWMGAGYLEGYGHHPGWSTMAIFIIASGAAGADKGGLNGFIAGCAIMAAVIAPIFFAGCYSRAKDYEQDVEATFNKLTRKY
jgi:hypothetical protein